MPARAATTVNEYIESLPEERRKTVSAVRKFVRKHLPKGYDEGIHYGMIYYHIPFSRLAETYNGLPLGYVGLGAHKSHVALYLMGAYGSAETAARLKDGFKREGKKFNMGKSCLRFQTTDDLALDAVGECIASISAEDYIAMYERSRLMTKAGAKKAARKATRTKKS